MKKLLTEWREYLNEMKLDIKVGDVLLGGKFKNKRINNSNNLKLRKGATHVVPFFFVVIFFVVLS